MRHVITKKHLHFTFRKLSRTVSNNSVTLPIIPQMFACTDGFIALVREIKKAESNVLRTYCIVSHSHSKCDFFQVRKQGLTMMNPGYISRILFRKIVQFLYIMHHVKPHL